MIEYSEATLQECKEILSKKENIDTHLWFNLVNNNNIDADTLSTLLNIMPKSIYDSNGMECIVRHKSASVKIFKEVLKKEDNCINSVILSNIAGHHNADVNTLMSILDKQKVLNLHNVWLLSSIINNPSANKNVLIATLKAINLHSTNTIFRNKKSYIDLVALIAAHPAADVEIFMELLNSRIKHVLINKQVLSNIIKHPNIDAGVLIKILNQVISNNKNFSERLVGEHHYVLSANYLNALELIITSTKATLEITELVLNKIFYDIRLFGKEQCLIDLLKIIAGKASSDTLVLLLTKFFETNTLVDEEFIMQVLLNKVAHNPAATSEILYVILYFFKGTQDIESIKSISKLVKDRNTNAKNKLMPLLYSHSVGSSTFTENDVNGNLAFIIMQYHSFSNSNSILSSNGELKPFKA